MSFLSTVRSRRSVRSFDGKPLADSELRELLDFCQTLTNPFGLPLSWQLIDAEKTGLSSPVIVGEKTYITATLPRAPHAEEAFGYAFEEMVLHAAELGIGTTWIAGTLDRKAYEKAVGLADGEIMPCISPIGRPAAKMSLRETMMRKGTSADSRLPFEKIFFLSNLSSPLTQEVAGDLSEILEAVRWAPSACNYQPWRLVVSGGAVHFYLKRNKGFALDRAFDTQKVDMGIALCHFALAARDAGRALSFSLDDPGLDAGEMLYIASYRFA